MSQQHNQETRSSSWWFCLDTNVGLISWEAGKLCQHNAALPWTHCCQLSNTQANLGIPCPILLWIYPKPNSDHVCATLDFAKEPKTKYLWLESCIHPSGSLQYRRNSCAKHFSFHIAIMLENKGQLTGFSASGQRHVCRMNASSQDSEAMYAAGHSWNSWNFPSTMLPLGI